MAHQFVVGLQAIQYGIQLGHLIRRQSRASRRSLISTTSGYNLAYSSRPPGL